MAGGAEEKCFREGDSQFYIFIKVLMLPLPSTQEG